MTAVTKLNQPVDPRPNLIKDAIAAGAPIETIGKLMEYQERWEANQAKKSFNAAIAAFKANPPRVLKTVEVGFDSQRTGSRTSYKHEDLADMLAAIDPVLATHGLWVRFKVLVTEGKSVRVTCVVGHTDGYSEEASMLEAAPDTSGNKNHIQAIGSTVSYLQRYTLKAALGMAAAKDDDAREGGKMPGTLSSEQVDEINTILLAHPKEIDVDKFLQLAGALSVSDIQAVKFESAKSYLNRKLAGKK